MVTAETFPSGLRLVTESMPHVRSVTVGVWLTRGSRHEHVGGLCCWEVLAARKGVTLRQLPLPVPATSRAEIVALFAPRAFLAVAPLEDENFAVEGVRECIAAARPVYALYGAEDRLAADYPAGGHDFPPESRRRAYAWFDRFLKPAP